MDPYEREVGSVTAGEGGGAPPVRVLPGDRVLRHVRSPGGRPRREAPREGFQRQAGNDRSHDEGRIHIGGRGEGLLPGPPAAGRGGEPPAARVLLHRCPAAPPPGPGGGGERGNVGGPGGPEGGGEDPILRPRLRTRADGARGGAGGDAAERQPSAPR